MPKMPDSVATCNEPQRKSDKPSKSTSRKRQGERGRGREGETEKDRDREIERKGGSETSALELKHIQISRF